MTDLIQSAQNYLDRSKKQKVYDESVHLIGALKGSLEEAVKALEWYGSMEKYKDVYQPTGIKKYTKEIENDNGYLARTTLKRIKGENGQ